MREFAFNVCMLYELVFNLLLKKEHIDCVNAVCESAETQVGNVNQKTEDKFKETDEQIEEMT